MMARRVWYIKQNTLSIAEEVSLESKKRRFIITIAIYGIANEEIKNEKHLREISYQHANAYHEDYKLY